MNPPPAREVRPPAPPGGARRALWGVAAAVVGLSVWANLGLWVEDPRTLRFFPPFVEGVNSNFNRHLGAEHFNIARALVAGKGFSNPFFADTGPTAWMAPVYPLLLAALLALTGSHAAVAALVVLLKGAVLIATGWLVARVAVRTRRRLPAGVALCGYGVWLVTHFFWFFQITHDVWLVLGVVDAVLLGGYALLEREPTPRRALAFGALGGVALLTSPIAGLAWGAVAAFVTLRRRALRGLALAFGSAALVAAPWIARNALVFGELVLVKSNFAYDAYQANYVAPDGVYDEPFFLRHPVWTTIREPDSSYRRGGEAAFVAEYRERLRAALRERPERLLAGAANRLLFATLLYKPYRPHFEGPRPLGKSLVHAAPFLGLLALLLRGWGRDPRVRLAILVYAVYLLPYLVAALYIRYLLPLTPVLVLFAFWGADALAAGRAGGGRPGGGSRSAPEAG